VAVKKRIANPGSRGGSATDKRASVAVGDALAAESQPNKEPADMPTQSEPLLSTLPYPLFFYAAL